jgi:hypothetical protein
VRKLKSVAYAKNPHDLEALKQNIREAVNKFPEIYLKEFRHVSQQRADIFNFFYDGECSINYYI